ncbi:hypothetical protein RYX36_013433 [Vicia faba]
MNDIHPLDDTNMEFLGILGEGSFGRVSKYRVPTDNTIVAVKQISIKNASNVIPGSIIREVSFLKELNHPNIVRLLNVTRNKDTRSVNLIFECLDCDLNKYIKQNQCYGSSINDPFTRKSFMYQILSAVEYCHSYKIIHQDLKPRNLLIDQKKKKIIKLADFGLARELADPEMFYNMKIATQWYVIKAEAKPAAKLKHVRKTKSAAKAKPTAKMKPAAKPVAKPAAKAKLAAKT